MAQHKSEEPYSARPGFNQTMAGRHAECDGGGPLPAGLAGREEFTGTLTGEYVDQGSPPWRWYRLAALTKKPDGYIWDSVWCESDSLFLMDEPANG